MTPCWRTWLGLERLEVPELLGHLTALSGTVLIIDTGLLNLWSHDRPPVAPPGSMTPCALTASMPDCAGDLPTTRRCRFGANATRCTTTVGSPSGWRSFRTGLSPGPRARGTSWSIALGWRAGARGVLDPGGGSGGVERLHCWRDRGGGVVRGGALIPIHAEEFWHEGRGPELVRLHWQGPTSSNCPPRRSRQPARALAPSAPRRRTCRDAPSDPSSQARGSAAASPASSRPVRVGSAAWSTTRSQSAARTSDEPVRPAPVTVTSSYTIRGTTTSVYKRRRRSSCPAPAM